MFIRFISTSLLRPLRLLATLVLLCAALPLAAPAGAAPTVRYVAPTGSDAGANTCAVVGTPCRTIPHSVAQAVAGDTISIAAGTYNGFILIDKDLILSGAGAASTMLDGQSTDMVVRVDGRVTASLNGVTIRNGAISGSCSPFPGIPRICSIGFGGGITNAGTLTVTNSTISGNSANGSGWLGGGIGNLGTLTLSNSTVSGNSVTSLGGGGIANIGILTVAHSTVSGNSKTGSGGGGIANSRTLMVTNSTISGNSASNGGGGIFSGGTLTVFNSTITDNSVADVGNDSGGGILSTSGTLTLSNSIIAGNTAPSNSDCSTTTGTITGVAANLVQDTSGCTIFGGTLVVGDPRLGPLADNGGPTLTHALLAGSAAAGRGDATVCTAAPVSGKDQRGVVRPQGIGCDLGAVESDLPALPVVGGTNLMIRTSGGSVNLTWDAGNAQTGYLIVRTNMQTREQALFAAGAAAIAYVDTTAPPEIPWCYAVTIMNGDMVLGVSDLVCAVLGFASGNNAISDFTLAMGQSSTAFLTWKAPAGGVVDAYALGSILTDQSGQSTRMLSADAVATTHELTLPTCFLLAATRAEMIRTSNVLCGIPGFSTFGAVVAPTMARTVGEVAANLRDRLSGVRFPVAAVHGREQ